MSDYPEHIIRATDARQAAQSGGHNLAALIEQARKSRVAEYRALALAAEALRNALTDTIWMARRYASGRSTYAPGSVNDAVRTLRGLGVSLGVGADGTVWARDGMFGWPADAAQDPTHQPQGDA